MPMTWVLGEGHMVTVLLKELFCCSGGNNGKQSMYTCDIKEEMATCHLGAPAQLPLPSSNTLPLCMTGIYFIKKHITITSLNI